MTTIKKILTATFTLIFLGIMSGASLLVVHAASLTALSDTMSNQTISATSSHVIKFTTPTGVTASAQTIVVTFPSGFNFTSKAITGLTLSYGASTGMETTATIAASAAGSTTWGAVFSGSNNVILTLTSPTSGTYIAAGNKVILTYSSANSTNPSSAANYAVALNVNGDTGSITVPIITNSQVAITATVAQTLSFSISNNTIDFGTLSTSQSTYATSTAGGSSTEPTDAHTISAGTNGTSGYNIFVSGATLTSGINTISGISGGSAAALSPGSAQFGIRATATGGGSGTVTAPFNGSAGNYGFGSTTSISNAPFASAAGVTTTNVYNVNYAANISPAIPAGSYVTTLTYAATANF